MKHLLLAAVAAATLAIAAVPASAQVRFGADPWGTDVQVGPFSFGVGPRYDWRRNGYDPYWRDGYRAFGRECRLVRERFVTPSDRVEFRSHRVCDY